MNRAGSTERLLSSRDLHQLKLIQQRLWSSTHRADGKQIIYHWHNFHGEFTMDSTRNFQPFAEVVNIPKFFLRCTIVALAEFHQEHAYFFKKKTLKSSLEINCGGISQLYQFEFSQYKILPDIQRSNRQYFADGEVINFEKPELCDI